jgi:hypothetical protein
MSIKHPTAGQAKTQNTSIYHYMDYMAFNKIVEETFTQNQILKVIIKIHPLNFFNQQKSISEIHRTISNSKQIMGGQSNRVFWQNHFKGGLYTFEIGKETTDIVYYLQLKSNLTDNMITNLKSRIKKVVWSEISVTTESSNLELKDEFEKIDVSGIRFIGDGYKNKNKVETTPAFKF